MDSCGIIRNWQHFVPLRLCFDTIPTQGLISDLAMRMFQNASQGDLAAAGADGRFINVIFRCFGDDIDQAILINLHTCGKRQNGSSGGWMRRLMIHVSIFH